MWAAELENMGCGPPPYIKLVGGGGGDCQGWAHPASVAKCPSEKVNAQIHFFIRKNILLEVFWMYVQCTFITFFYFSIY
jgi:hypothetical protein